MGGSLHEEARDSSQMDHNKSNREGDGVKRTGEGFAVAPQVTASRVEAGLRSPTAGKMCGGTLPRVSAPDLPASFTPVPNGRRAFIPLLWHPHNLIGHFTKMHQDPCNPAGIEQRLQCCWPNGGIFT